MKIFSMVSYALLTMNMPCRGGRFKQCRRQVQVAITPTIGGMCVTWISACCGYLCSSIVSVDGFMVVDIGSL